METILLILGGILVGYSTETKIKKMVLSLIGIIIILASQNIA